MSVSDGQKANAATFNQAFMSRTVDTDTTGTVGLNNASSGGTIANAQQTINDNETRSTDNENTINSIIIPRLPTTDQKSAMDNANAPTGAQPFLTTGDPIDVTTGATGSDDGKVTKTASNGLLSKTFHQGLNTFANDSAAETFFGTPGAGDNYWNTTNNNARIYDGTQWIDADTTGGATVAGNAVQLVGGGNKTWTTGSSSFANTTSLQINNTTGDGATIPYLGAAYGQLIDISVGVWFKTSVNSANVDVIFSHWEDDTNNKKWAIYIQNGDLYFDISNSGSAVTKRYHSINVSPDDNNWHQAYFTFTTDDLRCYYDGVELTTGGSTLNKAIDLTCNTLFNNTTNLVVGGHGDSGSTTTNNFDGNIDEPVYLDKVLSASEISEAYGGGAAVDYATVSFNSDTVSWWRNGDGDVAPTITDQVASRDATIVGTAAFVADSPPGFSTNFGDFSFDADIQLVIAGLPDSANNIPTSESPINIPEGQVAHVTPNDTAPGGNLSVSVSLPENVPDGNAMIMYNDNQTLRYSNVSETFPDPVPEYIESEVTTGVDTVTANVYVDSGASVTLDPGTWEIGYDACLNITNVSSGGNIVANTSIRDGSNNIIPKTQAIVGTTLGSGSNVVFYATGVSRKTQIVVASTTTYKLSTRCSVNNTLDVAQVAASSFSGSLTNPDNSSVLWARKISDQT